MNAPVVRTRFRTQRYQALLLAGWLILLLAAEAEHLGALFFGVPGLAHGAVRHAFDIPGHLRIVGVVALGHPDPDVPTPRSRSLARGVRGLDEVVHRGRFGRH